MRWHQMHPLVRGPWRSRSQAYATKRRRVVWRRWLHALVVLVVGMSVGVLAGPLSARSDNSPPALPRVAISSAEPADVLAGDDLASVGPAAGQVTAEPPPGEAAEPTESAAGPEQRDASNEPETLASQRMRAAVLGPFHDLEGQFGIAVKDLGSGRMVLVNETRAFPAASLYKLPIMYEVFRLRGEGALSFDEELVMTAQDAAYDVGTPPWPVGTRIGLGQALEKMITLSDNSSAIMLTRRVDARRVNEEAARLGLEQTHVRHDDLATSPLDMLRLLELLAGQRAVDSQASTEMVQLLLRQQVRNRIPMRLPEEATVANKTGDWADAAHDVGLVYGPRATLAVAFLSEGITDREAVYDAMARAARDLYDLVNDPSFATQPHPLTP